MVFEGREGILSAEKIQKREKTSRSSDGEKTQFFDGLYTSQARENSPRSEKWDIIKRKKKERAQNR